MDNVVLRSVNSLSEHNQVVDDCAKIFVERDYYTSLARKTAFDDNDARYSWEQSRVAVVDGRVVSHVRVVDRDVRIGRSSLRMGGLRCIYTLPQFRKRGVAERLIRDTLQWLKESGYDVSMLWGIRNFYGSFGFASALADYRSTVSAKDAQETPAGVTLEPLGGDDDVEQLASIYERNHAGRSMHVARDPRYWNGLIARMRDRSASLADDPDKDLLISRNSLGQIIGYAFFCGVDCREAGIAADEAAAAIAAEAARRARDAKDVELHLNFPPWNPLVRHCARHEITYVEKDFVDGGGMLLILDPHAVMKKLEPELSARLGKSELAGASACVEIRSEGITIALELRKGRVEVCERPRSSPAATLSLSLTSLAQLVSGYREASSIANAHSTGQARFWQVLFPRRDPFVEPLDRF